MDRALQREEGQAIVEAALLLPMWVGCLLGVLQMVLLQEARLLTEYAAWQSARAGIVRNGDPVPMRAAAHFVLAPTACPSRTTAGLLCRGGKGWSRIGAGVSVLEADGLPGVSIAWPGGTVSDPGPDFDRIPSDDLDRERGLLSFELVYWYELKIPFVDSLIWHAWRQVTSTPAQEGIEAEAARGRFFVPISSRQVMRMQSDRYAFPTGDQR